VHCWLKFKVELCDPTQVFHSKKALCDNTREHCCPLWCFIADLCGYMHDIHCHNVRRECLTCPSSLINWNLKWIIACISNWSSFSVCGIYVTQAFFFEHLLRVWTHDWLVFLLLHLPCMSCFGVLEHGMNVLQVAVFCWGFRHITVRTPFGSRSTDLDILWDMLMILFGGRCPHKYIYTTWSCTNHYLPSYRLHNLIHTL